MRNFLKVGEPCSTVGLAISMGIKALHLHRAVVKAHSNAVLCECKDLSSARQKLM